LAITPEEKILLVEQYRIPVHSRTIELPAGITGDSGENESNAEAAKRELLEETGFEAAKIEPLITGPASSGLTSETITIFLATGLKRVHAGGGIENEKISVHEVTLNELDAWLARKQKEGCMVEPKLYAALYFLRHRS
jgi:ADP-ribose pyrophosphatase